ncbi:MAG: TfoX/Sxy family protein [Acidimicrobiia bacterium]|nr:TfoX/Sxy family protein [Acidimicrobiia bacterium]
MPGGSDYQGPEEALARYREVVEASSGDVVVKGAKNPYTSRNGHMFSFLDRDGTMAIRLSSALIEEYGTSYSTEPVIQYGSVMRGYVAIPDELFDDVDELVTWFDRSYEWIGTLDPK